MWTRLGSSLHFRGQMLATDLEPVTPSPKKNYITALILVVVMVVGGIVILKAYEKRTKEGAQDDRPSFVTQISGTKDLTFIRQDGKVTNLMTLKGKVLVIQSLPQAQPDAVTVGVMKRLSEKYAGNQDVALVTLVLDPGSAEMLQPQLEEVAESLGAELPMWTVGSNERPTLHKFIKNEFKANRLPHEKDGVWQYDKSLFVIDRSRHVRKAVVPQINGKSFDIPFDFEEAEKWDADGIKTGTELTNIGQMEVLLGETIEQLLVEKMDETKAISPAVTVIGTGAGFLLLMLLIILKSKQSKRN